MSPQSSPADAALLAECEVDTYRASGPGGQKRNKTESAVRIRHRPTGIIVIAEESRSQAENRVRALRRLHEALALRIRHPVEAEGVPDSVKEAIDGKGRLKLGRRDARYLPAAASLLDLLDAAEGRVSTVAERLGLTTGNVSAFLTADDDLMAATNNIRSNFGLKPLRRD